MSFERAGSEVVVRTIAAAGEMGALPLMVDPEAKVRVGFATEDASFSFDGTSLSLDASLSFLRCIRNERLTRPSSFATLRGFA